VEADAPLPLVELGADGAVVDVTPAAGACWLASTPREHPASDPPTSTTAVTATAIRTPPRPVT
jgi:hypothetical protein